MGVKRKCSIPGCDNPHRARGWCRKHHVRWTRWGDPLYVATNRKKPDAKRVTPCALCAAPVHGLGLCRLHYQRWHKWGDPWFDGRNYPECKAGGCYKARKSSGYCGVHYDRWKMYGDPFGGMPALWREEYPVEPLAELIEARGGFDPLLSQLDLDRNGRDRLSRRWERAKERGYVDLLHADEFACTLLRLHPALIWPDHYWQFDDEPEEAMAA